jgi:hypothetical protein
MENKDNPSWAEVGKKVRVRGFRKVVIVEAKLGKNGERFLSKEIDGTRYWNVDALVGVK